MNIGSSNELLADFKLYKDKNNNNRLLKPFGYKVISLTVTVSRLEKTPGEQNGRKVENISIHISH